MCCRVRKAITPVQYRGNSFPHAIYTHTSQANPTLSYELSVCSGDQQPILKTITAISIPDAIPIPMVTAKRKFDECHKQMQSLRYDLSKWKSFLFWLAWDLMASKFQ